MSKTVKTISAHIGGISASTLRHNNRDIISGNVDSLRSQENNYRVMSGHTVNGTYYATVEEIYNLVFEKEWQAFQKKQRKSRRYDGSYLDYIRDKKQRSKITDPNRRNTTQELYEICIQVGNKNDTGFSSCKSDYYMASRLMDGLIDHICELPYVVIITDKELNDPEYKPPENCLLMANLVKHADEENIGIHMSFICCTNSNRGCRIKNSLSQTFSKLGYTTEFVKSDEFKYDRNGNVLLDENGNPKFKQWAAKKGVLDWIEQEIKLPLAAKMKEEYDWDRADKLSEVPDNLYKHLDIQDYRIAVRKNQIEKLTKECENLKNMNEEIQSDIIYSFADPKVIDYEYVAYNGINKSQMWDYYRQSSKEFWDFYHRAKDEVDVELAKLKEEKPEKVDDFFYYCFNRSNRLLAIIAYVCSRMFYNYKNKKYREEIKKLYERQKELKILAKEASSDFYKKRELIKSVNDVSEFMNALKNLENEMEHDYMNPPEYELSYDVLES